MASRVRGSSPAACMRLKSSRQETPASTRIRVRVLETTVLLPREPLASTVIRTMKMRIRLMCVEERGRNQGGSIDSATRDPFVNARPVSFRPGCCLAVIAAIGIRDHGQYSDVAGG